MTKTSRGWGRWPAVAVALVLGLFAAATPATAAPTTKNYSASLSFAGAMAVQSVSVPFDVDSAVRLVLENRVDSQQSFGSVQVDIGGDSLPTAVSVDRAGWTVHELDVSSGARYRVLSSGTSDAIRPGDSLEVTLTMPGTPPGTTAITTSVKQSNDFKGNNNDFTNSGGETQRVDTDGPEGVFCAGTCTPEYTSPINGVRADLTVSSSSAFGYTAGFTTGAMSCGVIPFGPTVEPEPFQVDTDSTSPVSKTIVLTFPKALSDLVPDTGTQLHPVCAGGDHPFPGSAPSVLTSPHEGLLLKCSDPAYAADVRLFETSGIAYLPMCVASRARNVGQLVVTVSIGATTVDPRVW